ncbi:hypothetical protein PENSPDRAFT_733290 [Peniophora sp. CONT]|nr:hypothetical protein PENSPDRAFT_733290 [Peniophora sp. CONT]
MLDRHVFTLAIYERAGTQVTKLARQVATLIEFASERIPSPEDAADLRALTVALPGLFEGLSIVSDANILESVTSAYRFACRLERHPSFVAVVNQAPQDRTDDPHEWRSYSYVQLLLTYHDLEVATSGLFDSRLITVAQPRFYIPKASFYRSPDYGSLFVDEATGLWTSMFLVCEIKSPMEDEEESLLQHLPEEVRERYRDGALNVHSSQVDEQVNFGFRLHPTLPAMAVLFVSGRQFTFAVYRNPNHADYDAYALFLNSLWNWRAPVADVVRNARPQLIDDALKDAKASRAWKELNKKPAVQAERLEAFDNELAQRARCHPDIVHHAEEMFAFNAQGAQGQASLTPKFRHALQIARRMYAREAGTDRYELPRWAMFAIPDPIEGTAPDEDEQYLLWEEMQEFTTRDLVIQVQRLTAAHPKSRSASEVRKDAEERKKRAETRSITRSAANSGTSSPLRHETPGPQSELEPAPASGLTGLEDALGGLAVGEAGPSERSIRRQRREADKAVGPEREASEPPVTGKGKSRLN